MIQYCKVYTRPYENVIEHCIVTDGPSTSELNIPGMERTLIEIEVGDRPMHAEEFRLNFTLGENNIPVPNIEAPEHFKKYETLFTQRRLVRSV